MDSHPTGRPFRLAGRKVTYHLGNNIRRSPFYTHNAHFNFTEPSQVDSEFARAFRAISILSFIGGRFCYLMPMVQYER